MSSDFSSPDVQILFVLAAVCLVAVFVLRRVLRRRSSPRAAGQPAPAPAAIMPAAMRFESARAAPPPAAPLATRAEAGPPPAAVPAPAPAPAEPVTPRFEAGPTMPLATAASSQGDPAIIVPPAEARAAQPKPARSLFTKIKWAVSLGVVVAGIGSGLVKLYHDAQRTIHGVSEIRNGAAAALPGCGDIQTTNVLRALFKEQANVTLTRIENPRQQSATNDLVECVIWLTRSDGLQGNVAYRIERQGASQFGLRVTGGDP